ncbi:MAG: DUF58 domain-containing protein [Treponema sp.]|jgi:uncharacterized protein (DUF58 family)|nr:DUF58 domain-containing protein [Treponema sp.]
MKPGRSLFIAVLLWFFLGTAAFFSTRISLVWFLSGLCLLPFVILDALVLGLLTDRLKPERDVPLSLAQGEGARVTLILRRGERPLVPSALLYDLHPLSMDSAGAEWSAAKTGSEIFPVKLNFGSSPDFRLKKNSNTPQNRAAVVFTYTVIPRERGRWVFPGLELLLNSPLRFWRLRVFHACESRGRTYPDFRKITEGGALSGLMSEKGQRDIRRRGQGLEFMSLRDYQEGDPVKSIDWRATGRRRKFIVREYQEEQDQQILFVLDSGYRLPGREFDSALNGMLLLSYAALKHGDSVAALTFGTSERWFPPRKGMSTLTGLMNGLFDLECGPAPSSPFSALEKALARLHRRTFIILVSNFREEDGESLSWILPRIRLRHLLLLVSFREAGIPAVLHNAPGNSSGYGAGEILETAAAFSYLAARRRLYRRWEHMGLLTLETTPGEISSALINRYLGVKRSGRL